jgi:hypothetical protein
MLFFLLASCGSFTLSAVASEAPNRRITLNEVVGDGATKVDEYTRLGQDVTVRYANEEEGYQGETAVLSLECIGDSLDQNGQGYNGQGTFYGGWRIKGLSGSCYGRTIDLNDKGYVAF